MILTIIAAVTAAQLAAHGLEVVPCTPGGRIDNFVAADARNPHVNGLAVPPGCYNTLTRKPGPYRPPMPGMGRILKVPCDDPRQIIYNGPHGYIGSVNGSPPITEEGCYAYVE